MTYCNFNGCIIIYMNLHYNNNLIGLTSVVKSRLKDSKYCFDVLQCCALLSPVCAWAVIAVMLLLLDRWILFMELSESCRNCFAFVRSMLCFRGWNVFELTNVLQIPVVSLVFTYNIAGCIWMYCNCDVILFSSIYATQVYSDFIPDVQCFTLINKEHIICVNSIHKLNT